MPRKKRRDFCRGKSSMQGTHSDNARERLAELENEQMRTSAEALSAAIVEEFVGDDVVGDSHTILLIQPGTSPETRTFSDYESVNECMEGVCKIYEEHLKRQNPNTPSITYDISQLFDFVDQLNDLSCLVYQKGTNSYAPYNKDWIKEKIYILLRRQAARSS